MTSSAVTMMTKAILLLTLFSPLISASYNSTEQNITISVPPDYTSTEYTSSLSASTQISTSNASPPSSSPSSPSSTEESTTTTQPTTLPSTTLTTHPTSNAPQKSGNKQYILIGLLVIIIVMLLIGCIHAIWEKRSGQDSSVLRLLQNGRERLTTAVGNLEDRMGLRLWQGGKRGGEEDDEEAQMREEDEGGQKSDDAGEGSSSGGSSVTRTKGKEDQEEDSDTSDDYSSMEGEDLRERALNKQEEEEGKEMSELPCRAVEGESSVDNLGGSEEVALVNSPQENEDVTIL